MAKPKIENYAKVLVVEGYGDLTFYAEALQRVRSGLEKEVFIHACDGRANIKAHLETLLNPGLLAAKSHIAVIVDADHDGHAAETAFARLLGGLTGRPARAGSWTDGSPRVGLWVAPGDGEPGEIETLVWNSWSRDPANERARACIEAFTGCMERAGFNAQSRHKGLLGALLAIRNDEDPRLGPGARAHVFDFERPEFSSLMDFLRGLDSPKGRNL